MKLDPRHSLSLKLLRMVLLAALVVGVVLSCAQIVYDAHKARLAVHNDAQRILAMVRDPSTQAVYSLDRDMAMQVLEGLFQHEAVRYAAIGHPDEPMLAEKSRPLLDSPTPGSPTRSWAPSRTIPSASPVAAAPTNTTAT